jgi:L-amino acid N-acyltransferase YncA
MAACSTGAGPGSAPAGQVLLRDGRSVAIRAAESSDLPDLRRFLAGLSLQAKRFRFFSGGVDPARIAGAIGATGPDRFGLVALDREGRIVAHALCIELGAGRAEIAVEVADDLHGQGLGTILLERLAQEAERRGVRRLVAEVLPENREMLEVFHDGFDAHVTFHEGVDRVEFPVAAWRLAAWRFPLPPSEPRPADRGKGDANRR